MSVKQLKIADFEWASVARYIVEISFIMGLQEVNWYAVHSFAYARLGPDKLRAQKIRQICQLTESMDLINHYVHENGNDLGKEEMVVLRDLYSQYLGYKELCEGHLRRIEGFKNLMNHKLEYADVKEGDYKNELPF